MQTHNFEIIIDGVAYFVKAEPFEFNDTTRFKVTYNNSEEFIFAIDDEASQFMVISKDSITIPDELEKKISDKLLSLIRR